MGKETGTHSPNIALQGHEAHNFGKPLWWVFKDGYRVIIGERWKIILIFGF